jgi:glycosyltransferase involved in cell wall biosynthesis
MQDSSHIRTLHLLPELKEGGLERGVIEKVTWLENHGVTSIVVSAGGIWLDRLNKAGIKHIELPIHKKNPFSIFSCARKLTGIIAQEEIHLVCAHSRVPAWVAHLATRKGNKHDPPLVIEAQAYYEPFWYSRVMCRGERVIATSGMIRDHMISLGCDSHKIAVVPRGFSKADFITPDSGAGTRLREKWGVPPDSQLIVGVGRITRLKGWDLLIEALAMMPDPKPYCVFVGSAHGRKEKYLNELKLTAGNFNLHDRVKFVGHMGNMPVVYAAADCVAMPSRIAEAFGRVVVEGIVSGTPVISTHGCGVAEFLGDEFEDFLIPMNDSKALADKILEVLNDPESTHGKIEIIAGRIFKNLTIENSMWATIDVYRQVCPDLPWPKRG